MPYYTMRFRGLTLDENFSKTPASDDELGPLLDYLKMPVTATKSKCRKDVVEGDYEGFWATAVFC